MKRKLYETNPKISLPLDMLREVRQCLGIDQVLFVIVVAIRDVGSNGVARLSARPVLVDGRAAVGVGVEMDVGALHLK